MEPRSGRRNRNNAPLTREKYTAREMDLRPSVVLKRPRRNVRKESARSEIWEGEWGRSEGTTGDAYLVRHVGYVNVIIPQILKGELSHARDRGE